MDTWPLKMGPIDYPQTSIKKRHYTLRNFPDESRFHLLCSGRKKSRKVHTYALAPRARYYELKKHNRVLIFL